MTEEERESLRLQDGHYLRGRMAALEDVVDAILRVLPPPALEAVDVALMNASRQLVSARDADEYHRRWELAERSWNPVEKPSITRHADGYLFVVEKIRGWASEYAFEASEGAWPVYIQSTPEALKEYGGAEYT